MIAILLGILVVIAVLMLLVLMMARNMSRVGIIPQVAEIVILGLYVLIRLM